MPLSMKVQRGDAHGDATATVWIGSRTVEGHTSEKSADHMMLLDQAAEGGVAAAKVYTTPLAVQQNGAAAVTANLEPSLMASHALETTMVDAPTILSGVTGDSPGPLRQSAPPATAGRPVLCPPASGIRSKVGSYNVSAALWRPKSRQIPSPQEQQKQPTPVAPRGNAAAQPGSRLPVVSTAPKRPAPGGEQQQQQKRQRIGMLPSEQKAAATTKNRSRSGAAAGTVARGQQRSPAALSTGTKVQPRSAAAAGPAAPGQFRSSAAAGPAAPGQFRSSAAAGPAAPGQFRSSAAAGPAAPGQFRSGAAAGPTVVQSRQPLQQVQRQPMAHTRRPAQKAAPAFLGQVRRMPLQLDTPIVLARTATTAAANASNKQQLQGQQQMRDKQHLQGKQQPPGPADSRSTAAGGKCQGLHKVQQQVGMKRAREQRNDDIIPSKPAASAPKPAATAAPASTAAKGSSFTRTSNVAAAAGMGNRAKATSASAGTSRPSAKAAAVAAIAANRLNDKAQLHSNQDHQNLLELEEDEVAGLGDLKGSERLHPDPVPQGRPKPGAAVGASNMQQRAKQQAKLQTFLKKLNKAPRATLAAKPAQAAAKQPQPAQPSSAHGMQRQPAAAAGAGKSMLQPRQFKQTAKLCKPAEPAHSGVAGAKRIKASPAEQGPQQQAGPGVGLLAKTSKAAAPNISKETTAKEQHIAHTHSNVSSVLVVQHTGNMISSHRPSPDKPVAPTSTPTFSPSSRVIDYGPPGYQQYVAQQPRDFAPICNDEQYEQYGKLYQTQQAMRISLQLVLEASHRRVKRALARQLAAPAGSQEQQQAALERKALKAQLTPLFNKQMSAKVTLDAEVKQLKGHISRWLGTSDW